MRMSPEAARATIPFGIASWSIADLRKAVAGEPSWPLLPHVVATPGETLRLNAQALDPLPQDASTAEQLAALEQQALIPFPVWDRPSRALVTAYFALIPALIEENREAIERKLQPFAGLYRPEDYAFSAPRPLPMAHLFAPPEIPTGDEGDYVAVDLAFWLAERIVAFGGDAATASPRRRREREERLARAGITFVSVASTDRTGPLDMIFRRTLRDGALRFWDYHGLPSSPFLPRILA
jgi:hypothetical protein